MVLRGVSHVFSKNSFDGVFSLRELKTFMLSRSIDFVLMTEYVDRFDPVSAERFIKECHNLSDGKITFIPGFKVPYKDAELLCIGVDHFVAPSGDPAHDLKEWKSHSKIVVWAHPHRGGYILYDAVKHVIDAVEVWNSKYDGVRAPRFKSLESLEMLRERGKDTLAFAGVSFLRESDINGPSILLEAQNDERHILETLRSGTFVLKSRIATVHAAGELVKGDRRLLEFLSNWSIYKIEMRERVERFKSDAKARLAALFRRHGPSRP